ncbi:hypothetical protein TRP8649_01374 [Pelagimonas phthalicica]|uniref:Uncharacterized protein n=1 Tax=Pelagimonas phthalicica TaxID=1037362 RepID=A0A238J978_9RHOB|nr:hypothetical protein [Pelagimonas phthalicica]TDS94204.1 hypothetical protein CLV87_0698 [Pelagimonas phthalicica]SMX27271.1 hypothetical protein TRP8649_01374 [Pelagimonas phthalicica]
MNTVKELRLFFKLLSENQRFARFTMRAVLFALWLWLAIQTIALIELLVA